MVKQLDLSDWRCAGQLSLLDEPGVDDPQTLEGTEAIPGALQRPAS